MKRKWLIIIIIIILLLIGGYCINKKVIHDKQIEKENTILKEIKNNYGQYVVTTNNTNLYKKEEDKYIKAGTISKDVELTLEKVNNLTYKDKYFKITSIDNYYIYYKDIKKIDSLTTLSNRYKNYIVFNKNIITKNKTSFYDENNKLLYKINTSINRPIIIKDNERYAVEYNDRLVYVKSEDVLKIIDSNNTDQTNTAGIAVLNYHFVYDETKDVCNQSICHTSAQFRSHLDYIKNNNIFTIKLQELEMYIDGKIQLPKSVVITIDDGWHAEDGVKIVNEYKLNATLFLITIHYDKKDYESEYVEVHSHGHNMHNVGDCPTGQGGAIQCMSEEYIQNDLKLSREELDNTTYFCYPFYEYNDYSIDQLKKAGFTMAFGGYHENGIYKAKVGIDKFRVPRYPIGDKTTVNYLEKII